MVIRLTEYTIITSRYCREPRVYCRLKGIRVGRTTGELRAVIQQLGRTLQLILVEIQWFSRISILILFLRRRKLHSTAEIFKRRHIARARAHMLRFRWCTPPRIALNRAPPRQPHISPGDAVTSPEPQAWPLSVENPRVADPAREAAVEPLNATCAFLRVSASRIFASGEGISVFGR